MSNAKQPLAAHQALVRWAMEIPDREFLVQPVAGEWHSLSFGEADDQARRIAAALATLGLNKGDKVAILAKNSAEWVIADVAIAMAGMISVPIYPTANADTVAYVVEHSEAKAVFVGKLDDPSLGTAIPSTIATIAFPYPTAECRYAWQDLVEKNEPLETVHVPEPDDVMTIIYTSGSTGKPKGAVVTYSAYSYSCQAALASAELDEEDRILSYLPLAHVVERMVLVGPSIYAGGRLYFVESLKTFADDLKRARPTVFGSVPRLWVKFQAGVHAKIPPRKLRLLLALPFIGRSVAGKIREGLGFEHCRMFASGSAPISTHTLEWYRKIGVEICEGWGMTETSGLACANLPFEAGRIGTIGTPLPGTELQTSEQGELLIRSPGLFTEYYRQPELTAEVFTEDGFFRTGDKAEWDQTCGGYRITGRVKEIFKSAKGKYVVPVPIEARLSASPLLEQICVIGAGLPAPIAVAVLSEPAQQLSAREVEQQLAATLAETNRQLESHERLSNMLVAGDEWTTENGMLTPTLKVKRDQIEARYQDIVSRKFDARIAWEKDLS